MDLDQQTTNVHIQFLNNFLLFFNFSVQKFLFLRLAHYFISLTFGFTSLQFFLQILFFHGLFSCQSLQIPQFSSLLQLFGRSRKFLIQTGNNLSICCIGLFEGVICFLKFLELELQLSEPILFYSLAKLVQIVLCCCQAILALKDSFL